MRAKLLQPFRRAEIFFHRACRAGPTLIGLLALALVLAAPAAALEVGGDFAQLPILHKGRLKPLDTFARDYLTNLGHSGRQSELPASAWLAEVLFTPELSYQRPLFKVSSPDVRDALKLPKRPHNRYSFNDMADSVEAQLASLTKLAARPDRERTGVQNLLVEAYLQTLLFFQLSRSLSLLLPDFSLASPELARELGLQTGRRYSWTEMQRIRTRLSERERQLAALPAKAWSDEDRNLVSLARRLELYGGDKRSLVLRVIPPQWADNRDLWLSPWSVIREGRGSPQSARLFKLWQQLAETYRQNDSGAFQRTAAELRSLIPADKQRLSLETFYNLARPFHWSLLLYAAAFAVGVFAFARRQFRAEDAPSSPSAPALLTMLLVAGGALIHAAGIGLRMYLLARPPVATLYESILFAALAAVVFGLLWGRRGRGPGLIAAAASGAALLWIARGYGQQGDTLEVLVAVLDTNFWLATHVVFMTLGYGCSIFLAVLGHLYLAGRAFGIGSDGRGLRTLESGILASALVAGFFSLFGTLLGGIWADQSWGRFWGWDPKENGALLLVLWQLLLLHGRISGLFKPLALAVVASLANVVVALAWFGVNLLNVGLHSYGFTEGAAFNLALFCAAEMLLIAALALLAQTRVRLAAARA